MANPIASQSQMADSNNKPLISDQQTFLGNLVITYTTGDPSYTAGQAVTVANGATPTVRELLELILELKAQNEKHAAVIIAHGLMADA